MERLDESSFDAIIVGTGITESVLPHPPQTPGDASLRQTKPKPITLADAAAQLRLSSVSAPSHLRLVRAQVVAAALARVGKRVLHLDALPFYGASHATLPLASFRDWLQL